MASLCPAVKYVVPELHDASARLVTACHTIKVEFLKIQYNSRGRM